MKDMYGNDYVRPTACPHADCLPWMCLHPDPEHVPPTSSPAQDRQADRERRRKYREVADGLRPAAGSAPTPALRDRLGRMVSDMELMAAGRTTGTAAWNESRERGRALEHQQAEVKRARSWRLLAGATIGIILGVGFLIATQDDGGQDRIHWIVSSGGIAVLATCLATAFLNLLFGLRGGSRRA